MSSQKREKANEVYGKYEPAFGKRVPFEEAFPNIADLSIEIFEFDSFIRPRDDSYLKSDPVDMLFGRNPKYRHYTNKRFPGEYIDCSGTLCYSGGFSILKIIREMNRNREEVKEGKERCQGYEGSPKGRKKYKACLHEFEYRIKIKYEEENKTT